MGEVPMMTNSGTFITNGVQELLLTKCTEALVFFDHDKGKTHASGKLLLIVELFLTEDHG